MRSSHASCCGGGYADCRLRSPLRAVRRPRGERASTAWPMSQFSAMGPSTRAVTLVRVRLKSFLCKYYFSRMSKFHSSFSLAFFLAKFPKHISFCKQGWQEGVTPSPSCSCNRLGVQFPSVTSFQCSKHTSPAAAAEEEWKGEGMRKGLRRREEPATQPGCSRAPPSWSHGDSPSVRTYSLTSYGVLETAQCQTRALPSGAYAQ